MNRLLGAIFTAWGYVLIRAGQFLIGVAMDPVYNLLSLAAVITLLIAVLT